MTVDTSAMSDKHIGKPLIYFFQRCDNPKIWDHYFSPEDMKESTSARDQYTGQRIIVRSLPDGTRSYDVDVSNIDIDSLIPGLQIAGIIS